MAMIDADKLKPALEAWQTAAGLFAIAHQASDRALLRGDEAMAEKLYEVTQKAACTLDEKVTKLAVLVEALVYQAEHPDE